MCHETPDTILPRIVALLGGESVPWTGNEILGRIASGDFPCEAHFDETIRLMVRTGKLTCDSDPFDPRLTATTRCRLAYLLSPEARTSAIRLPQAPETPKPRPVIDPAPAPPPPPPAPASVAPALPSPAVRLEAIGRLREEKNRLEKLWSERFGDDCFRKGSSEFLKTVFLRARVHGLVPRLRDALEKSLGRPVDDFEKSCETLIRIHDRDGTIPVGMIESGVKLDLLSYAAMDLDRAERELQEGKAGNPANAREILGFLKSCLDDGSLNRFRSGANPVARPASPPPPASDPLIGTLFGAYKVVAPIGKGGMGVVYEGLDETLDRRVALKVLHPQYANNREYQERFLREARNAANATLDHPNITQIYAAGRQGPYLWLAMQLVRGRTLTKHLEERGRLPAPEALKIARQIAEGLSAAHAAKMIHRDIKPDNLMIDESGRLKIMDFGLMRSVDVKKDALTVDGLFVGTLEYASPEQCKEGSLDARTDLYSLGVVLYELLSGKRPYHARSPLAYLSLIPDPQQPPVPLRQQNPDVPAAVDALVHRLLSKRPEERPATAEALIGEIDRVRTAPESKSSPRVAAPSVARRLALSIAGWAILFAAAIGAAIGYWPKDDRTTEPAKGTDSGALEPRSKGPVEPDPESQAASLAQRIGEAGALERLLTTFRSTRAARALATEILATFEKTLSDEEKSELVGAAAWSGWDIDTRDAPGGSVVPDQTRRGFVMSSPSPREQVRLLRKHNGAEKGYRVRWTYGTGVSDHASFMVAFSLTRWVEIGPKGIALFRVQGSGGREEVETAGRAEFPERIGGGVLSVVPKGEVVAVFLGGTLIFALPARDYPLGPGLQLGMSGGNLQLESIRVPER